MIRNRFEYKGTVFETESNSEGFTNLYVNGRKRYGDSDIAKVMEAVKNICSYIDRTTTTERIIRK